MTTSEEGMYSLVPPNPKNDSTINQSILSSSKIYQTMNSNVNVQQLKSLKLSGMADSYQTMINMPLNKQPALHDALATMIDAETQQRNFRRTTMLTRLSKLRYKASLHDISYSKERNLDKNDINSLADCNYIQRGHNITITGATGTGKSYLRSAKKLKY